MKYRAKCKKNYSPKRAKAGEYYPIRQVNRYESYAQLPKGEMSIEHPSFDFYFDIEEIGNE